MTAAADTTTLDSFDDSEDVETCPNGSEHCPGPEAADDEEAPLTCANCYIHLGEKEIPYT